MKLLSLSKIKSLTLILFFILLFIISPQSPESIPIKLPFGGQIIGFIPTCNYSTSSLIFLKIPPAPLPPTVMYGYGYSFSFEWGPPTHPGQQLLGAAWTPLPCIVGACPACTVVGGGPVILFHGSSL